MPHEGVVILHGIFRTHRSMGALARFLERHGYAVLNLGYPSTRLSLEELADHVHPAIAAFAEQCETVHFIGCSMGGLLIRTYLKKYRPAGLGRVVMIGTPNQGSEVADYLKNNFFYRRLYGPAGQQLVTDQRHFQACLGTVDYELGILAGNRPLDMLSARIIARENDGKVAVESTRLEGMRDHRVLPCNHTFFPASRRAWAETLHFLQQGAFT